MLKRPIGKYLLPLPAVLAAAVIYRYADGISPSPWKEPILYPVLLCGLVQLLGLILFCACLLSYFCAVSLDRTIAGQALVFAFALAVYLLLGLSTPPPALRLFLVPWVLLEVLLFIFYLLPARKEVPLQKPVTGRMLLVYGAGFLLTLLLLAVGLEKILFHACFPSHTRQISPDALSVQRTDHVLEARRGLQLGVQERVLLPLTLQGNETLYLSYLVAGENLPFPVRAAVTLEAEGANKSEVFSRLIISDSGGGQASEEWQALEPRGTGGSRGTVVLFFSMDLYPGLIHRLANLDRLLYYALSRRPDRSPQPFRIHWSVLLTGSRPEPPPVNILLFDIDTLRADALGCYGFPEDISPAVDRVAEEGILFRNVYSQATWTLPSTVSLMSSLYVDAHKIFDQSQRVPQWPFPSMAEFLRRAGYVTLGAVDGGFVSAEYGFATGFDRYSERPESGTPLRNSFHIASDMIREFRDQPFFMFLQSYIVHEYFHLTSDYTRGTRRLPPAALENKTYARYVLDYYAGRQEKQLSREDFNFLNDLYKEGIRTTDLSFERFISRLKRQGLYDNTWIIITSDHGEGFGEYHNRQSFRSLMHGRPPYEDQARVPLIMKFPKSWNMPSGRIISRKVNSLDILPTILDYLHLNADGPVQGRSLRPIIEDAESAWQSPTLTGDPICGFGYIGEDGYKLIKMPALGDGPQAFELYDLERDAWEDNPLPEDARQFDALLNAMNALQARSGEMLGEAETVRAEPISPRLQKRLKELGYIQ